MIFAKHRLERPNAKTDPSNGRSTARRPILREAIATTGPTLKTPGESQGNLNAKQIRGIGHLTRWKLPFEAFSCWETASMNHTYRLKWVDVAHNRHA